MYFLHFTDKRPFRDRAEHINNKSPAAAYGDDVSFIYTVRNGIRLPMVDGNQTRVHHLRGFFPAGARQKGNQAV